MQEALPAVLAGLGLCLGLIISIGAQNAVVLRYGIRKEHVGAIVIACIASEVVLQTAGVAGIGLIVEHAPWIEPVARWIGAIFLVGYAILCARRAWRGTEGMAAGADQDAGGTGGVAVAVRRSSAKTAVLTVLACTWLNPQAIIETTVVMGGIASTHGDARWWFLVGGLAAAAIWFTGFGYGARLLAPLLRTPRAWRVLDAIIAVIMLAIAVGLVLG